MRTPCFTLLGAALLCLCTPAARAQNSCDVARPMDGQRLLRRTSLDLRGYVPSYEEQALQSGRGDVSEATINAMLASDDFVGVMRRYHDNLMWPNISQAGVASDFSLLYPQEISPGVTVYYSPLRAYFLRNQGYAFVPCSAQPASYNPDGSLQTTDLRDGNGTLVAIQEGYVEVEPYWAPGTMVKVCAYDAQPALAAPLCPTEVDTKHPVLAATCAGLAGLEPLINGAVRGAPQACDRPFGAFAPGCGCGPGLRTCHTQQTAATVVAALQEQEMRLVEDVVANDRPYTDVITAATTFVNGPLAHYLRYQSRSGFDVFGDADPSTPIPADLTYASPFSDWRRVERTGRHAGVLTTPGYLLKFQSNRGRAHRFYNAFECSFFIPDGPLPPPSDPCSKHEDLTQRCGCNACHVALEPMAAHWGRFSEYGFAPLDNLDYPTLGTSLCSYPFADLDRLIRCDRFYQLNGVGEELPYVGMLRSYVFRSTAQRAAIEEGPARLAQQSIASGAFARCTARRMWTHFMKRAPTADEEATVIETLAGDFAQDDYNVKNMVKRLVMQPAYGRQP